jgi:hypothetical protein
LGRISFSIDRAALALEPFARDRRRMRDVDRLKRSAGVQGISMRRTTRLPYDLDTFVAVIARSPIAIPAQPMGPNPPALAAALLGAEGNRDADILEWIAGHARRAKRNRTPMS